MVLHKLKSFIPTKLRLFRCTFFVTCVVGFKQPINPVRTGRHTLSESGRTTTLKQKSPVRVHSPLLPQSLVVFFPATKMFQFAVRIFVFKQCLHLGSVGSNIFKHSPTLLLFNAPLILTNARLSAANLQRR